MQIVLIVALIIISLAGAGFAFKNNFTQSSAVSPVARPANLDPNAAWPDPVAPEPAPVVVSVPSPEALRGQVAPTVKRVTVPGPQPVPPTPAPTPDKPMPVPTPTTTPAVVSKNTYKDGTYSADGVYGSPAGKDSMGVTITLKNDVITAASITNKAQHPVSKKYQDEFATGLKTEVVGKKMDSINLDVVNGASLTTTGFMDALAKIKAKAQ